MSNLSLTRRAALASACAFALSPAAFIETALAKGIAGGVRVDVGPLRENSGDPTATWVARALSEALAARGAGGMVVRIDYVILGPSSGGVGPSGSSPDQMIGEVIVGGVARPLRATTYYYPMPVDQTMIEQSNYDRIARLSEVFADWVVRGF